MSFTTPSKSKRVLIVELFYLFKQKFKMAAVIHKCCKTLNLENRWKPLTSKESKNHGHRVTEIKM